MSRQSSICLSAHNNRERGRGGGINNKDRPIAFSIYCFVSVTNNYDSREVVKRRTRELRNRHVTRPRHTYRADTRLSFGILRVCAYEDGEEEEELCRN